MTARGAAGLGAGRARPASATSGVMLLTLVAYGALFTLLGVLLRRPVIPGLLFLFVWELLANLPGYLPRFTLTAWLRSLVPHRPAEEGLAEPLRSRCCRPTQAWWCWSACRCCSWRARSGSFRTASTYWISREHGRAQLRRVQIPKVLISIGLRRPPMTRSRLVVFAAMTVVVVGVVAGVGALCDSSPARAAVGPLPGEALILPADARFVMGLDVKRFTASPFYKKFAAQRGMKPEAFAELEEKTGLNPERDLDQIVIAGAGAAQRHGAPGVAVALGHFDRDRLGRAIETDGKGHGIELRGHHGLHLRRRGLAGSAAGGGRVPRRPTLVLGRRTRCSRRSASRTHGEAPLKTNAALMARLEKVKPGSTFWMVGDQTLLATLPKSVPGARRRSRHAA